MPKGLNSTAISLIPKSGNPTTVSDFRPISCCNTIYKCISKILACKLKIVLHTLIDQAQYAFIQGRSISDLAKELFRNYHRSSGNPRYAFKIDLQKAFDTVNWDFLFKMLHLYKFPLSFINWIKSCITSAVFLIKVNNSLAGYFGGTRGLRQDDPLSPYLFVLIIEVLSIKLNWGSLQRGFNFHWKTKDCTLG